MFGHECDRSVGACLQQQFDTFTVTARTRQHERSHLILRVKWAWKRCECLTLVAHLHTRTHTHTHAHTNHCAGFVDIRIMQDKRLHNRSIAGARCFRENGGSILHLDEQHDCSATTLTPVSILPDPSPNLSQSNYNVVPAKL